MKNLYHQKRKENQENLKSSGHKKNRRDSGGELVSHFGSSIGGSSTANGYSGSTKSGNSKANVDHLHNHNRPFSSDYFLSGSSTTTNAKKEI